MINKKIISTNLLLITILFAPFLLPTSLVFVSFRFLLNNEQTIIFPRLQKLINRATFKFGREAYQRVISTYIQYDQNCFKEHSTFVYTTIPNSKCRFSNLEFDVNISFGKYGERNYISKSQNNNIKRKILVLGDSHAMGWGVSDEEIFTSHLSKFGIESLNLAVSSYGTVRELERLKIFSKLYPLKYKQYKTILIQYNENDSSENQRFFRGEKILSPSIEIIEDYKSNLYRKNYKHITYKKNTIANFSKPHIFFPIVKDFYNLRFKNFRIRLSRIFTQKNKKKQLNPNLNDKEIFFEILKSYSKLLMNKEVIIFVSNPYGKTNILDTEYMQIALGKSDIDKSSIKLRIINPWVNRKDNWHFKFDDHLSPTGHQELAFEILNHMVN